METEGGCLCGSTRYSFDSEPVAMGECYCTDCQKETGSGHNTAVFVRTDTVKVTGPIKVYKAIGGSGGKIERTFCSECGSTIFSAPEVLAGLSIIRAGTLDDPSVVKPSQAIFVSHAQPWDQPNPEMNLFDEAR